MGELIRMGELVRKGELIKIGELISMGELIRLGELIRRGELIGIGALIRSEEGGGLIRQGALTVRRALNQSSLKYIAGAQGIK